MNTEQARFNMIEQQIRPWNVSDSSVLQLLAVVKREDFCPPALRALAFTDMEIPLGDVSKGQVMLAPRVQARMLQDLNVQKHEKVLHIGAGSGFMSALLGRRAAQVLALEIDPALAQQARDNLQKAGIANVQVMQADGANAGNWGKGPYDVIVLSGSVAELPSALLAQLKVGGRLGAIAGEDPMMRACIATRRSDTQFDTVSPWDTMAPRLHGFAETAGFQF